MKIGGFQKLSMVDYPGHVACTIFLSGCNLNCKFCHNPSLVKNQNSENEIEVHEIMDYLNKRKGLIDGVCVSGGEPTIQEGLPDLIRPIKEMGYKVKLDTNGTNPRMVEKLLSEGLVDYVAVDIKATEDKYQEVVDCYVNTDDIKKTIRLLMGSSIDYEFRTTMLPELDGNDIEEIVSYVSGCDKYVIQQFRNQVTLHRDYSAKEPHDEDYINEITENIRPMVKVCEARGIQ